MKVRWLSGVGAKLIAVAVLGFLLMIGLCSAGRVQDRGYHDGAPGFFDTLGGLTFALSSLTLLVGIVTVSLEAFQAWLRRREER